MAYWIQTYPQAWAEIAGVGLAEHQAPVIVEIKASAQPIRVRQYPMSSEAWRGIAPHINRLLEAGKLRPCRSAWNTPLLPSHVWYTTLDLKDAFFSIALAPNSQHIFAFEWHDENTGTPGQLTWTRLPQGFKNSPTLFNEALNQDLDYIAGATVPSHFCSM
jgi:hypothetical protein